MVGLAFDGCDAGEDFAFDGFEEGAAAGRYVGYLVGKAELVDASHGVAAAYERERAVVGSFNDGFGDSARTGSEVVEFEYAGRTVPEDGLCALDGVGEEFAGLGTGVHAFPAVGNFHYRHNLGVGVVGESVAGHAVGAEHEVNALGLGFGLRPIQAGNRRLKGGVFVHLIISQ